MKNCSSCRESKPLSEFCKNLAISDGLNYECRSCSSARQQSGRKKNPTRTRETQRRNYYTNREKISARNKAKHKANPGRTRKNNLKKYGLTEEDVVRMADFQSGACAICGKIKKLVIDHNHKTGAVRELLCTNCNTALGKFGDCEKLLQTAIDYLKIHS